MTDLKSSPHGNSTIVGATGDHNSYVLFPFEEQRKALDQFAVPFYLYLPEAYRQNIMFE